MGVDRYRVCELYAAGPDAEGSGSGYRVGDRLVLTARHVIVPALAGPGGPLLVRPAGEGGWLPARVEWQDAEADAALIVVEDEHWQASAGESVLRWGELAGTDPVPCAAVGFPWASTRPEGSRDTAHIYGHLAPLGQLKAGRLDLDVASASPAARAGGSPWAGMSGAGVIADNHLVGVITLDPARYQDRLVALPTARLLTDPAFRACLDAHGVLVEVAPVGAGWYLRLPGEQTICLDAAYLPVSRRFLPALPTLLRPEHGLVPFLGRQALLDQITGWCQDSAGRPVMLMTGGGGSGKTRLGREACVQMLVAGWDAGLADDQRRSGTATDRLQRPALLVIDEADLHTSLITSLIEYMRWDDTGPEIRLLLLARAPGTWWDRLILQQDLDGTYTLLDLDRHPIPPASRAEHFHRAATAFAAYRDTGEPPADLQPPGDLVDPAYREPLLIHIAALLRTVGTPATPPPGPGEVRSEVTGSIASQPGQPVRQALLRALCERERTRWYQLGEHLSFNPDLPVADQVVALATLTAAADQPGATSLLAALPNQAEVTRIGAEALVVWAHRLYSGSGYWNPLRPDLLAEQHLTDTAQLPLLAAAAAQLAAGQRWEPELLTQLLAEMTRGAMNQPALQAALSELLAAALPRIVELVVTAGHAGLADLTSLALQLAPQPALAATLAEQMPEYSVQLAALAATLTSQRVTYYRAVTLDGQPDAANRLAASLNSLAVRLADLDRREDALAAVEESVAIRRELAAARPDAVRPHLAVSLGNLSNGLGGLGRLEDALATGEEATGIYRELAADHPDAFQPDLARALSNLAGRLRQGLGRREDALAAVEEATVIYRELAADRADAFRPDLAAALNNLTAALTGLGRREDALAAGEESVTIYRELAADHPDAFQPDLARALSNLTAALTGLGRREDALAAGKEATGIYRELAADRPDAFRPDLAKALSALAAALAGLGQLEDALAAVEEATGIYRELAADHPDAFRPDLAAALSNLGLWLADLGQLEDALAAVEEATGIYRELAADHPDAFRPDLARALRNLTVALTGLGRREDALAAGEGSVTIYRELAADRPDAFRPDLAAALSNLTGLLAGLGRREEALAAVEESVTIRRELAADRPDVFRPDLAKALNNLTAALAGLGRREDALAAGEESVTISRELAADRPDVFRPDLAKALNNLTAALAGLGRREDALAAIQEAISIYQELAAKRPEARHRDLEHSLRVLAWVEHDEEV